MNVQDQIENLRAQRAAEWLQILREGEPRSHAEFVSWVTESPRNLDEFLKLDALSRETRSVLQQMDFDRDALPRNVSPKILEFRRRAHSNGRSAAGKRRWIAAVAASVAVAALAGGWTYARFLSWDDYATGVGEQRTVELVDGSLVYMNGQSQLAVRLGSTARELRLSQGEALFNVARDTRRPFKVSTHDAVVEAVGTQFNVNAREDGTQVAVVEGKVRITRGREQETQRADTATALKAGEAAWVTRGGKIERDAVMDVTAAVAWSHPELILAGTSLEDAVEQFNRHHRSTYLRLEGVPLGSHHYTGIFDATDAESFATLLAREPDLAVERRSNEILIRRR